MASLPSLKPLLQTFRQPTWLAVFTSAGIHGALFAASPSFSSSTLTSWANPDGWNRLHTVPLVELTPEEQGRLPNFSNQSLSLFPDLNQEHLFNVPPRPSPSPPNPLSTDLSTAGLTPDWLSQSPFRRQTTQILPPPSIIPLDINPFTGGALPPFPPSGLYPDPLASGNSNGQSRLESPVEEAAQSVEEAPPENSEQAAATTTDDLASSPTRATPERISELRSEDLEQRVGDLDSLQIAGRINASSFLNPAPVNPDNAVELKPTDEVTTISLNPVDESLEERLQAYAHKSEGTSEEAVIEALNAWTADIQDQSEIADLQPTLVELPPVDNPVRVCLPQEPTSAMIGILINPEGQIVDQPRLLKSTGYGALNNWAAQLLGQSLEKNQDLSQAESYQALRFEIPINYDAENCVDRTRLIQPNG